jgi:hypothetical protein
MDHGLSTTSKLPLATAPAPHAVGGTKGDGTCSMRGMARTPMPLLLTQADTVHARQQQTVQVFTSATFMLCA